MKNDNKKCPECGGHNLYQSESNSGPHAGALWPGLGGFWRLVKSRVVVCADCGYSRHFLSKSECERVVRSDNWRPV